MAATKGRPGGSPFLTALIVFVVVAAGIYLTGLLATALLRYLILPLAAVAAAWLAARGVYRTMRRD